MTDPIKNQKLSLALLLGLLLLTAAPTVLLAQPAESVPSNSPEPTDPSEVKATIGPVPTPDIANRAAEDIVESRDLMRSAQPNAAIETIETDLPDEIVAIMDYAGLMEEKDYENAPPKLLNESRQQWLKHDRTLSDWLQVLDSHVREVQTVREQLSSLQEIWRLTAEDSTAASLPEAVQNQIQSVRGELQQAEIEIEARRQTVLTLQSQVSEQRIHIAVVLETLDMTLIDRQNDLFRATLPPIWAPVRDESGSLAVGRDLADTWYRVVVGVSEFFAEEKLIPLVHFCLMLLIAVLLWLLNRRTPIDGEDEAGALAIARRPLAASGLLTLLILSPFYSDASVVFKTIIPILALPFAAVLSPVFVPAERRPLVYSILLLALLVNIQNLIVAVGFLRQLLLVATSFLGLVSLFYFRRQMGREDSLVWPAISRAVLGIGSMVLVVIFVAALLGFIQLGELLANAAIESAYLALILLAGYLTIDALLLLVMRTRTARRLNTVQKHNKVIRAQITKFVKFLAIVLWVWVLLNRLLVRHVVAQSIMTGLTTKLQVGSMTISLGAVLLFFLVLWLTFFIAKLVRHLLEEDLLYHAGMSRGRNHMISLLVNYSIIGLGFLAALAAAGIRVEQFALIGGALGVGVGFGLQNVVSNFVSGLILVFERPIQVGDTIEVGTLTGTVRRIGIRSSTIGTFDGAEVIVPNSDLISRHVVNWTLSNQLRRMEVKVRVKHGTDPGYVQELLTKVAQTHPKVLAHPAPYSLFHGFGDSSLAFVVRFWTTDFDNWIFIASEVTVTIDTALKDAGIEIPFPQQDLHIYSVDPPAPIPEGGQSVQRPGSEEK